ncbi:MAG: hypothetical protein JST58_18320 [Bacteroidetes bacterium]|nr:hypothetical protein [Bacteroidota bacterium]
MRKGFIPVRPGRSDGDEKAPWVTRGFSKRLWKSCCYFLKRLYRKRKKWETRKLTVAPIAAAKAVSSKLVMGSLAKSPKAVPQAVHVLTEGTITQNPFRDSFMPTVYMIPLSLFYC